MTASPSMTKMLLPIFQRSLNDPWEAFCPIMAAPRD
jgi:hypothetical protein